jgi:hypothetical protein
MDGIGSSVFLQRSSDVALDHSAHVYCRCEVERWRGGEVEWWVICHSCPNFLQLSLGCSMSYRHGWMVLISTNMGGRSARAHTSPVSVSDTFRMMDHLPLHRPLHGGQPRLSFVHAAVAGSFSVHRLPHFRSKLDHKPNIFVASVMDLLFSRKIVPYNTLKPLLQEDRDNLPPSNHFSM